MFMLETATIRAFTFLDGLRNMHVFHMITASISFSLHLKMIEKPKSCKSILVLHRNIKLILCSIQLDEHLKYFRRKPIVSDFGTFSTFLDNKMTGDSFLNHRLAIMVVTSEQCSMGSK